MIEVADMDDVEADELCRVAAAATAAFRRFVADQQGTAKPLSEQRVWRAGVAGVALGGLSTVLRPDEVVSILEAMIEQVQEIAEQTADRPAVVLQ